jgi:integrase
MEESTETRASVTANSRAKEPPSGPNVTFAQLFEEFLAFSSARGRSPTTLHGYRIAINGFWLPVIGTMPIGELTAHKLDTLYAGMLTRPTPAAPSTVRRYHAILSAAMTQAVKWQWISTNPARMATLPGSERRDPVTPRPEEVRALIAACASESEVLGMFVLVAATSGCRRGELAALRWSDYTDRVLHIRGSAYALGRSKGIKTTKTGRQRRVVVPEALADALEAWRSRCAEIASQAGVEFGAACFMFPARPDGFDPVNINSVSSSFRRVAKRLGMPLVHFHSLRHFAATELISGGVDPRTAATRLGHANPSMTLSVYAHATSESELMAAEIGARVLKASP